MGKKADMKELDVEKLSEDVLDELLRLSAEANGEQFEIPEELVEEIKSAEKSGKYKIAGNYGDPGHLKAHKNEIHHYIKDHFRQVVPFLPPVHNRTNIPGIDPDHSASHLKAHLDTHAKG